uniref:Uncharacterized protein n=1 Tax=Lactuca sativa TaxID=4236 RepID=A0A9R1XHQ4_LACSA|nr:hypothetical protein LSAT_V11C300130320 [Lactuca sativa]
MDRKYQPPPSHPIASICQSELISRLLFRFECSGKEIAANWQEKCILPWYNVHSSWSRIFCGAYPLNISELISPKLWDKSRRPEPRAGFGYWLVRKYIISEDGEVDVGVVVTCIILHERHPFGNGCSGVLFGCILHDHEDCKENAMKDLCNPQRARSSYDGEGMECIIPLEWTIPK